MNSLLTKTLLTPVQIGKMNLQHRVVMAPLTRSRSVQPGDIPGDLMRKYYAQRATQGGFIVSEATTISPSAKGWFGAPGLFTNEQIEGWKKIVSSIHAKGGFIFSQLWHTGRSSHIDTSGFTPVTSSVDPKYMSDESIKVSAPNGWVHPSQHRALDTSEIKGIVEDYGNAAQRAMDAGFDGVELHAANGYLVDQFLQDGANRRTDIYGGSIANRSRFLLEIVAKLVSVWGPDRVAVRIAPGGTWNGMSDSNPNALFDYVAEQLNRFDLAYLHIIEPRVRGNALVAEGQPPIATERLRKIFKGAIISAGGYEPQNAEEAVRSGDADLVAFGKNFVANPDLVARIRLGVPLNPFDRATFYTFDERGYVDYPFYGQQTEAAAAEAQAV